MTEDNSLFDLLGTEITSRDGHADFMEGIGTFVAAIEEQYPDSPVVCFETRALAHQISATQEQNTILYDIALSLRVLSGRAK
jgi:hypothetical protein